jgi:hypothetical protein
MQTYLPGAVADDMTCRSRELWAVDTIKNKVPEILNRGDLATATVQIREALECSAAPAVMELLEPVTLRMRELQDRTRRSAEIIVPLVMELAHPDSVVDVGCGLGTSSTPLVLVHPRNYLSALSVRASRVRDLEAQAREGEGAAASRPLTRRHTSVRCSRQS